MSLSFLAPLFLAGLAALAIPIVVHLRRRHEREEVEFPSLMFLRDLPFRSDRRRRIRHHLLLALRVLALALLAAAFARPFLEGDGTATADVVGPREVVLVLDRSWSMAYEDRWRDAAEVVRSQLESLGPRDRVSLVFFDEGADAPVRSTPDRRRVLRLVDQARPGDRATRLAPALRLARSILETSTLPRREVVLVSDFQAPGREGRLDAHLPPGVSFRAVPVGEAGGEWANTTVAEVVLERTEVSGEEALIPTARILQRGAGPGRDSAIAVLEVDGEVRERTSVRLDGPSADVEFGPVPLGPRPLAARVRLEADALPVDDVHHFVLSPGRALSILVVEPPDARENASLYLQRALELSTEPPIRVSVTGSWPAELVGSYDVVVVHDRGLAGGGEALRDFLSAGGGMLWAPGSADPLSPGGLGGPLVEEGSIRDHGSGDQLRLGTVNRDHPIFQPFRESGTGNFSTARFFRSRRLTPTDTARVVARFDDGSPALVEGRMGGGRTLVWASTLHTFWSDLPLHPIFVPFLHRSVIHLANRPARTPAYRVGAVISAPAARDSAPPLRDGPGASPGATAADGVPWVAVETPEGERIESGELDGPLILERSGFYRFLEEDGEAGGIPVAVNVDPEEGDLERRDVDELRALVSSPEAPMGEGEQTPAGTASLQVQAEDRERHQGIWRFLLGAAFLFLVGETALSNRLSRATTGG